MKTIRYTYYISRICGLLRRTNNRDNKVEIYDEDLQGWASAIGTKQNLLTIPYITNKVTRDNARKRFPLAFKKTYKKD